MRVTIASRVPLVAHRPRAGTQWIESPAPDL